MCKSVMLAEFDKGTENSFCRSFVFRRTMGTKNDSGTFGFFLSLNDLVTYGDPFCTKMLGSVGAGAANYEVGAI